MSCLEFVNKYSEESEQNKREEVLDDALVCLKLQEERRIQDLYEFIDDFVTSHEYLDYVNVKKNISKHCAATQYDPNDITVECKTKEVVEKYPLTEERKKMHAFKTQFERYEVRRRTYEEVKKQERGIQAIRAKIHQARRMFECTWESKQKEKEKTDQYLMEKYSRKFGIDLNILSHNTQLKLLERFKNCHHVTVARKKKKHENVYKIIEKLIQEYKIKKKSVTYQEKFYEYKIKPAENIKNMEIVGTKIELIDREKLAEPEKPIIEKIIEDALSKTEVKSPKKRKGNNYEKERKKGKGKAEKRGKKKKTKEKKIKARREKSENKLQLPIFPICNPRAKILPENIFGILDLVEEFRDFDNAMENKDMWHVQRDYILGDTGIEAKPDPLLFQNFDVGKSYHKTVTITNVSPQIRKVRFLKYMFADQYDEPVFEVETFGIQKLFTGCKIKFYVNFQPYDQFKAYDGKLAFLSYDVRLCQYYQFELSIRCIPKYSDLRICPEVVNFGNIPIWRTSNLKQFKVIQFQNKGAKTCTICIKKQLDPLDMEEILDEENKENVAPIQRNSASTFQVVADTLDECLKNVDNNFQFEHSFFSLGAREEKRIKVFFKNASYIGNYFEKYTADVYEEFECRALDAAGCQTMSLHAETIGHFLMVTPEILDFGTCSMNSCYQMSFELSNSSGSSQAISVRVPSYLKDFVQCDVSMVYLSPGGNRMIFVKFNPRDILTRDSCPYYDKSSSILEFPIHLYVVSRSSHDYPPVKLTVYAILANFEDLTISCSSISNLSNFLGTLLIDMGNCSIYETIWTDVFLTNNTAVTQVCGFVDVPQAVTLMPNLGFCKLGPGRRKKFRLYLSPTINDFPSFSIGNLRNSSFYFKISVDTIISLGQISKQINPKKLVCSLDMMEKQLTRQDNELFVSMVKLASEIKEHFQFTTPMNKEMNTITPGWSLIPMAGFSNQDSQQTSELDQINKGITSVDTVLDYQNFLIVETNSRKEMWWKVNLKRPLLEFSHQAVEFPDTPCGSYSVMVVRLHALEREIERPCQKKKPHLPLYEASFQILGGSEEIRVEPSCGRLKSGEVSKHFNLNEKHSQFRK